MHVFVYIFFNEQLVFCIIGKVPMHVVALFFSIVMLIMHIKCLIFACLDCYPIAFMGCHANSWLKYEEASK